MALLVLHVSLLLIFATNWVKPSGSSALGFLQGIMQGRQETVTLSKHSIMSVMLSSLVIGLLCARSLHYQFFAYLAWASPFLLWRAGIHPILIYVLWGLQEWAWNVYPSTNASSAIVVLSLAVQMLAVFVGGHAEVDHRRDKSDDHKDACTQ